MKGKNYVRNIEAVPLSNSTVSRRICDMAEHCQKEVINRVKQSQTFSLQMDESTDVEGLAVLLVFVRYIYNFKTEKVKIYFYWFNLFLRSMIYLGKTFHVYVQMVLQRWQVNIQELWLVSKVKTRKLLPFIAFYTGMLWRFKRMPPDLVEVLEDVTKIVNFIKARPLNSRIFQELCEDMGKTHKAL